MVRLKRPGANRIIWIRKDVKGHFKRSERKALYLWPGIQERRHRRLGKDIPACLKRGFSRSTCLAVPHPDINWMVVEQAENQDLATWSGPIQQIRQAGFELIENP